MPKVAFFLPLALLLIVPVHAETPRLATGTLTVHGSVNATDIRLAGDNAFEKFSGVIASFNGGINGEGALSGSLILHNSTGLLLATGQIAFTGSVLGSETGSAVVFLEERVTVVPGGLPLQLISLEGHLVITNGSGGLAGLHGEGTFDSSNVAQGISYSLSVHFES